MNKVEGLVLMPAPRVLVSFALTISIYFGFS